MKTASILLLVLLFSMVTFISYGQGYNQTIVKLPKRLANQTSCTVTLINLDSQEKFTYVTNFNAHPAINLASYPSGQVYFYSITIKGEIVNKGNFFYPLQVNKPMHVASIENLL